MCLIVLNHLHELQTPIHVALWQCGQPSIVSRTHAHPKHAASRQRLEGQAPTSQCAKMARRGAERLPNSAMMDSIGSNGSWGKSYSHCLNASFFDTTNLRTTEAVFTGVNAPTNRIKTARANNAKKINGQKESKSRLNKSLEFERSGLKSKRPHDNNRSRDPPYQSMSDARCPKPSMLLELSHL